DPCHLRRPRRADGLRGSAGRGPAQPEGAQRSQRRYLRGRRHWRVRGQRVHVSGNEITADRDEDNYSVVYYLVSAPRGASVDLSANNGPISIRSVDGL